MRALALLILAPLLLCGPLRAQDAPGPGTPPPQVQELMRLLQDPVVRSWIEQSRIPGPARPAPGGAASGLSLDLSQRLARTREHLSTVLAAVPRLPAELSGAARMLMDDMQGTGRPRIPLLLLSFIALGFGSELLFRRASRRTQAGVDSQPADSVSRRLKAIGLRLGLGVAAVAVFAIGSLGAFLLFDWPPLLKHVVVGYLIAAIGLRSAAMLLDVALVPPRAGGPTVPERLRILPVASPSARFWRRRLALFVGYFAFGWITVQLMGDLGFSTPSRHAAGYLLGLGLLAIGLEALWRRPQPFPGGRPSAAVDNLSTKAALSVYAGALWLLWVAGLAGLFWLGTLALLLPAAIGVAQRAVTHLMRPAAADAAPSMDRGIREVCLERGVRLVLIVAAVLWLAHVWSIDLVALTARDSVPTRLVRGVLTGVVVLLAADLLWQVAKAAIDAKLRQRAALATASGSEAVREARLRTLLPIFRNVLMVLIAVIAILTALAALGVEIGPLIAGAGVLGVAVGFGAQTLVRDIISGVFYLLDDAFRVGEYIQSGNYKGTVESFSLRSVKLRHHRGALYTIPFGQLGAVQNMSRDWVIDKLTIGVTYDTDLDQARKLVKKIGQELAADPEYADKIIEPLKMQGVDRFGEYAIELRLKMMTKPNEQFGVRRKAYARIKQAFDEAGIKFAFPTVQVTGGPEGAAAAQHLLAGRHAEEARAT